MKVPYANDTPPEKVSDRHRRLLHARRQAVLADLEKLPRDRAPYDLEIGCGHGHFLAAYAEAHPERYCIGIDVAGARLERARRKSGRAGLRNVAWLQGEALLFLQCLPEWIGFSRVFILFPDPWPKKRHHKHRLVRPSFLERLAAVCRPDATLYFRTDHLPYAEEVEQALVAGPSWEPRPAEAWPWERASVFQNLASDYRSLVARRTH